MEHLARTRCLPGAEGGLEGRSWRRPGPAARADCLLIPRWPGCWHGPC